MELENIPEMSDKKKQFLKNNFFIIFARQLSKNGIVL